MEQDVIKILDALGCERVDHGRYFMVRSPFREDNNPSMLVWKDSGFCKDFGGRFKGNISKLWWEIKKTSVKTILPNFEFWKKDDFTEKKDGSINLFGKPFEKKKIIERPFRPSTVEKKGKFVHPYDDTECIRYCLYRGFPARILDEFDFKYCAYGSIKRREDPEENWISFSRRLTIPIWYGNTLCSVEGRDVYGTSSKKVIYPKNSKVSFLYNYQNLKKDRPLVVVEGLMDLFKVYQVYENVTTTFGINITSLQASQIKEFPQIIIMSDNDDGGKESVWAFDELLETEFEVATVPRKDPGECTLQEIQTALDDRISSVDWVMNETEVFEKAEEPRLF